MIKQYLEEMTKDKNIGSKMGLNSQIMNSNLIN